MVFLNVFVFFCEFFIFVQEKRRYDMFTEKLRCVVDHHATLRVSKIVEPASGRKVQHMASIAGH